MIIMSYILYSEHHSEHLVCAEINATHRKAGIKPRGWQQYMYVTMLCLFGKYENIPLSASNDPFQIQPAVFNG